MSVRGSTAYTSRQILALNPFKGEKKVPTAWDVALTPEQIEYFALAIFHPDRNPPPSYWVAQFPLTEITEEWRHACY